MIERPNYLILLKKYRDVQLVKVLTGVRRCGKSTILEMLKEDLLRNGIKQDHLIQRVYSSDNFDKVITSHQMFNDIKKEITDTEKYYLLLDEVQEIPGWEKAVNSLLEGSNTDIYVTGSNSKLMPSEISTYLSGRYVSIPVFTLSFSEYLEFKKDSGLNSGELFNDYLRYGGFPLIASNNFDETTSYQIVQGIFDSVVAKDIVNRYNITNIDLFNRVVKYVFENVGKTFSANTIVKYLKNEGRSLTIESIYNYLEWLEKAYIIYRCSRYDLQGKAVLKTQEKFYLADTSLKYGMLGCNSKSVSAMLENVVFFELLRKGYQVYIGKNEKKEIDFVAIRRDEKVYVQVCRELPEDSDREISNLLEIKDHYPKYVVTLNDYAGGNIEGIKIMKITDFLLKENY